MAIGIKRGADDGEELNLEVPDEVARGEYSNLVAVAHSMSEFVMDFARIMPGMKNAFVVSRVILTPDHAKRLLMTLHQNIAGYERVHGPIEIPESEDRNESPSLFMGERGGGGTPTEA